MIGYISEDFLGRGRVEDGATENAIEEEPKNELDKALHREVG
jgi:hypothetical protein